MRQLLRRWCGRKQRWFSFVHCPDVSLEGLSRITDTQKKISHDSSSWEDLNTGSAERAGVLAISSLCSMMFLNDYHGVEPIQEQHLYSILPLLWQSEVHYCDYCAQRRPPLDRILSQSSPSHCMSKSHSKLSYHSSIGLPNGLFPSRFAVFCKIIYALPQYLVSVASPPPPGLSLFHLSTLIEYTL